VTFVFMGCGPVLFGDCIMLGVLRENLSRGSVPSFFKCRDVLARITTAKLHWT
jgi:hypothetical protein